MTFKTTLSSWGWSVNTSGSSTLLHLLILSQKAVKINHSLVTVIALNHLVGQQDAGDGLSVGQHGFVVQVLFPVATAVETGWAGDVKHHNAAHRAFIVDPGHGNETLLTWKEGQVHNVVHPSVHGDPLSARRLWKCVRTCDVPQLQSHFFFIWPLQHLHRKLH